MNARCWIVFRKFMMRGMTIGASSCYRQTALQQTFPVCALRVVFDDLVLCSLIPHCRFMSFAMTACTEIGNIYREYRRCRIFPSADTVRAVTFLTYGCIGIILCEEGSMDALLVFISDLGVTGRAIHFLRQRFTRPLVRRTDTGMTLRAGYFRMT